MFKVVSREFKGVYGGFKGVALYCNIIEYKNIHIHLVLYKYPLSVVGSCSLLKLKGISGYKIFIGGKMY